MLSAEEITDLRFFGHGRKPKKVVAVSRLNRRISIGQVLHGSYSGRTGIVVDNGDSICSKRTRYNSRARKTEPVALFAWTEQWQYEYERQCECEKLEEWLSGESRAEYEFFVLEYVAVMGGRAVPRHYGFSSIAKEEIRRNLYRLNVVDLHWLAGELFGVEKKKAA